MQPWHILKFLISLNKRMIILEKRGRWERGRDEYCQQKWSLLVILPLCEVPERVQLIFLCWTIGKLVSINHYIIGLDHLFSAVLHAHAGYSRGKLKHCFASLPSQWKTGPHVDFKIHNPRHQRLFGTRPQQCLYTPLHGVLLCLSLFTVYLCTKKFSWKRGGESGSIQHRPLVVFIHWSLLCGRKDFLILITQTYHLE